MSPIKTIFSFAICIAGTLLASTASHAQDAQRACGSVTLLQRRIVERADEGIESLRSFVWTARVVHGIGMEDVRTGLDNWRATVICQKEVAAAALSVASRGAAEEASSGLRVAGGER